jgi:hypothetical protein
VHVIIQLLEVLIGLVLVYLVFSTIASAVVEAIEMALQKRGEFLKQGLAEILSAVAGDGKEGDLKEFYESPFISSLFRDSYDGGKGKLPAYIPPERFTDAVLQLANEKKETFEKFVARMKEVSPKAAADVQKLRDQCIRYFNESMQRVSSWYQRYARWWLLSIGLCIAAAGNVDTLDLMRTLSQDDALREQVVEEATRRAANGLPNVPIEEQRAHLEEQLKLVGSLGLPIGWNQAEVCTVFRWYCPQDPAEESEPPKHWFSFAGSGAFWSKLLGVSLTAIALTFSAPFWFDLLNQMVNLRSSLKPKATSTDDTTVAPATKPASA